MLNFTFCSVSGSSTGWIVAVVVLSTLFVIVGVVLALLAAKGYLKLTCKKGEFKLEKETRRYLHQDQ